MNRLMLTLVLCAASVTVLAEATAPDRVRLALNWKAEPQFGGFYAAAVHGHYAAQGLDVEIIEGGSGTPTIQVVGAGRTDFAIVSADELVISHERGAGNVVAVFATYQTNPQAIMAHRARGFESLEALLRSDGTLLWQAGLPYAQYLTRKYGPLKVRTAPYLGGIGNFQNDPRVSQQCFFTSEPLTARRAGLDVQTFLVADSGYNPYTTVLATTRALIEGSPDQVERMVAAVRAGWESYLADPAPTNRAMAEVNRAMDAQTFAESAAAQAPLIRPEGLDVLGGMTLERWQTLVDQLRELGVIRHHVDPALLFLEAPATPVQEETAGD
ncbi:MAG: ABC transporter substrate-binding protein [Pseudomonadales bacterium]|nr:ABC transporter substrate-binding protein [Pseudomonadales bacterium]